MSALYRKSASHRPRFAVLADVIARYFVSIILFLAVSSGVFWWYQGADNYFAIALAVLVVSCPCALSLATPVAYTIAIGAVRKLGVLINDGAFLEKLSTVDAVVFDKTGTLTEGTLRLEKVAVLNSEFQRDQLLQIASSLEVTSLHPITITLRNETREILPASDLVIEPGQGVSGSVKGSQYRLGKAEFDTT